MMLWLFVDLQSMIFKKDLSKTKGKSLLLF